MPQTKKIQYLKKEEILPAVILLGYFFYQLATGLLRAHTFTFGYNDSDTGVFLNSLWQAGHWKNPVAYADFSPVTPAYFTYGFLGKHFIPIGFIYGVFFRFLPMLPTAIVLFSLSFTVSGFFIYKFSKHFVGTALSLWLLILYLGVYTPASRTVYIWEWATPYISAALYFWIKEKYKVSTVLWILSMMFKEYIGLMVLMFGMLALIEGKGEKNRRTYAVVLIAISFSWVLFAMSVTNYFEPAWSDQMMFKDLGHSKAEMLINLMTRPATLIERIFTPIGLQHLSRIFSPLFFVSLIGYEYAFAVLPVLLINFLPDKNYAISANAFLHYHTFFLPFIVAGGACGIKRILSVFLKFKWGTPLFISVIVLSGSFFLIGALKAHLYQFKKSFSDANCKSIKDHARNVKTMLSYIPSTASAATENHLLFALANRSVLSNLENAVNVKPDFILKDAFYAALGAGAILCDSETINTPEVISGCGYSGYELKKALGSLILCEKAV